MSSMDVDPPTSASSSADGAASSGGGGKSSQQEKTLKVHPLAIIGISDHQTRIQTSGSPLSPNSPILGLLFGYQHGLEISIIDAEEMEYSFSSTTGVPFGGGTEEEKAQHKQSIQTKIELHQKVFPNHEVIGWYRVGAEDGPTEEDLRMNNGVMREYNESPLFVLMNSGPPGGEGKSEGKADGAKETGKGGSQGDEAREKLERDESLPLSIYETLVTVGADDQTTGDHTPRAVFVNLEFELETFGPERIAVERVFHTQRGTDVVSSGGAGGEHGEGEEEATSGLDAQLQSVRSSIESMNARVAILLDFLKKTQAGEIPPDYALLRQVNGLAQQLPFVMATMEGTLGRREFTNEYEDMLFLSYLASVAKTCRIVDGYTGKFRVAHESGSASREMRRGY